MEAMLAGDNGINLQKHVHGGALKRSFDVTERDTQGAELSTVSPPEPGLRSPLMGQMGEEKLIQSEFAKEAASLDRSPRSGGTFARSGNRWGSNCG